MKYFILLLSVTFLNCALADLYTDRFDDIDVDEILSNKRLLATYIKCILDNGRCTSEGKEIKLHIKDAMQTGCEKCTETQKIKARQVVGYIREHETASWEDIKKKYDPGNKYKEIYEAFLNAKN